METQSEQGAIVNEPLLSSRWQAAICEACMHRNSIFPAIVLCLAAGFGVAGALVEPPHGLLPTLTASAAGEMASGQTARHEVNEQSTRACSRQRAVPHDI